MNRKTSKWTTSRNECFQFLFVKINRSILYRGLTISKSTLYRNSFELYDMSIDVSCLSLLILQIGSCMALVYCYKHITCKNYPQLPSATAWDFHLGNLFFELTFTVRSIKPIMTVALVPGGIHFITQAVSPVLTRFFVALCFLYCKI